MHITEELIRKIMNDFGKEERIFQSEAQFQFALAWELQKQLRDDGTVLLEVVSCTRKADRESRRRAKRFYSDIILKSNTDNSFVVLELKYKTKSDDSYGVTLTNQGASDEGRYDYLWDIRRIELLKNHDDAHFDYNPELGTFSGGYAVLLTNENQYWQRTRVDGRKTLDCQFAIGEGDVVAGTVDWNTSEKKAWMRSRPELVFDGSYQFRWEPYYDTGKTTKSGLKKEFKYLITKIDP